MTREHEPTELAALRELAETYRPGRDAALARQQLAQLRAAVIEYADRAATPLPDVPEEAELNADTLMMAMRNVERQSERFIRWERDAERIVHEYAVLARAALPTAAEQEREAGRLEALAIHERYQRGEFTPAEYERLRADLGKQLDDLTRVDV